MDANTEGAQDVGMEGTGKAKMRTHNYFQDSSREYQDQSNPYSEINIDGDSSEVKRLHT